MERKDAEQIYYLNKEIKMYERELEKLRNKSSVKAVVIDGMPGSAKKSDIVGDTAIKIADYEYKIAQLKHKAEVKRAEVAEYINNIDDSLVRQIIFLRCIKLYNWNKIAEEIGGNNSEHSVKKIYYRFFK